MPFEVLVGAGGVLALLAAGAYVWVRAAAIRDREVFRQMEPIMEDLWQPLRFLADLRSVWANLTPEQRAEIEQSSTYRDRFHEKRAESMLQQLEGHARRIRSLSHRRIRQSLMEFVREWETKEPDSLKVILAMVRREATPQ